MSITITPAQIKLLLPSNKTSAKWTDPLNNILNKYAINTVQRAASFISQTAHESGDYKLLSENLNYSAAGLLSTFPKYFTAATAASFARNPEKIANRTYAGRMGNGNEQSGDGYKYRGRGLLQVTGKSNYLACSKAMYGDDRLITSPEMLETIEGAIMSAVWYWNSRSLNALADAGDVLATTKKINGGTIGLEDRQARYTKALTILKG